MIESAGPDGPVAAVTDAVDPGALAPGRAIEATVERLAYGGEGVARVEGMVVFVPWTAPGDRVRATIAERRARWARARLDRVLSPGEDRVSPPCPVYGVCGGCRLQHLGAEAQRRAKALAVEDALRRIGRRRLPAGVRCEPAAPAWGYRHRAVFSWRWKRGALDLGLHAAAEPGRIVPIDRCPILVEEGNAALARALESALADAAPAGDPAGPLEGRLALRILPGGAVQAGVFAPEPDVARRLAGSAARGLGLPVTWGRWSPATPLAVLAPGAPRLEARLHYRGSDLRVGFDSFLQVDLDAAERVYDAVLEALGPGPGIRSERVVDGYAGVGVVTCALARHGARVTAIESHPGAAADLRANAARAGGEVHVLELPAERVDWCRPRPDAVVLNPPRGGCPPRVLVSIGRSTARRIVYAACDPTTLARDVRRLGAAWRLDGVRVFDLFPQTAHVETVARLSRGEAA